MRHCSLTITGMLSGAGIGLGSVQKHVMQCLTQHLFDIFEIVSVEYACVRIRLTQ